MPSKFCNAILQAILKKYEMDYHQTYSSSALWDRNERFRFRDQNVTSKSKVPGHSGITYAKKEHFRLASCCCGSPAALLFSSTDVSYPGLGGLLPPPGCPKDPVL